MKKDEVVSQYSQDLTRNLHPEPSEQNPIGNEYPNCRSKCDCEQSLISLQRQFIDIAGIVGLLVNDVENIKVKKGHPDNMKATVRDLREEISKLKKENDDLRERNILKGAS